MGVSDQRHAPATLYPRYPLDSGWVSLRASQETEARGKSFASAGDRTPVVQSVLHRRREFLAS
jgi:hypothetical protein